ncbi:Protein bunched, class 2 isoform [Trichuris trichiura]|uniref:Protein bunched, class 2 isoform n=1 Tax=Trichuris trichiura TaxID=36087 RepID=A0A077Z9K2_TRITR|nr:Protein bunched, class 2 isoform [Trichuris trichiura]
MNAVSSTTTWWPLPTSTSDRRYSEPAPSLSLKVLLDTLYGDARQAATGGSTLESGATPSEVAIDNKIEQAMDLVKTHLLYAVREEVEVLKERIEKLEKTSRRLEAENKVLREHAPPEIVAQLGSLVTAKDTTAAGGTPSSPLPVPLVTVVAPPNSTGDSSSGTLNDRAEGDG